MPSDEQKPSLRFNRIVLKLSGEALAGEKTGINPTILEYVCDEIASIHALGAQIAIVPGAGNIFRGAAGEALGMNRVAGDHMGMLATVINSLAIKNALGKKGVESAVMSAIEMKGIAEPYIIEKADRHLTKGRVVIAAGGTGHPYFTTDTAAALRAVELGAGALLKASRVEGVYSGNPEKDPDAVKFDEISFMEVIKKGLRVMDLTSVSLCMDNRMPIVVFNLFKKGAMKKILSGGKAGTIIS